MVYMTKWFKVANSAKLESMIIGKTWRLNILKEEPKDIRDESETCRNSKRKGL
jgi:hypothetical protein